MKTKDEVRGIYLIERIDSTDEDPRKYYVGQALDIFKRFNQHCNADNPGIDSAIYELGVTCFSFRVLELVKYKKDLNVYETKWIKHYRNTFGDACLYNISQTSNPRNHIDVVVRNEIVARFREDIGQSIYAIAEKFDVSYETVINIRKPLLNEKNLKWIKGNIVDITTHKVPNNWRGYQFTKILANRIRRELAEPGKTDKDIRYVSSADLKIFLHAGEEYNFAPSIE